MFEKQKFVAHFEAEMRRNQMLLVEAEHAKHTEDKASIARFVNRLRLDVWNGERKLKLAKSLV